MQQVQEQTLVWVQQQLITLVQHLHRYQLTVQWRVLVILIMVHIHIMLILSIYLELLVASEVYHRLEMNQIL
ncbi:hypothetical protein XJ20_12870 [Serratia liquefaciens]|nr:hypothetical protein XJ20_12870 [Serratia liquefaciens]